MKYGIIKRGAHLKFTIVKPFYKVNWKLLLQKQPLKIKPEMKFKGSMVYMTYALEDYYFHDYYFERDSVDYELLIL